MSKKIKLIYDSYENNTQYYGFEKIDEIKECKTLKDFDTKKFNIDFSYNKQRNLNIYTWGIMKHQEPECELSFDLTKFTSKTDKDIKKMDGRDEEIQISILQHPKYNELVEKIVNEIENNDAKNISFFCNHGKHRSVGFAEILKKYYYQNSIISHLRFLNDKLIPTDKGGKNKK